MNEVVIVRPVVSEFAIEMEKQLLLNEHKGGWDRCSNEFFIKEIDKNIGALERGIFHSTFRRRCANIANFAMMLADNDRRDENRPRPTIVGGSVDYIKDHFVTTGDLDES